MERMRETNTRERYPGSHEPFLSCSSCCDRYLEKSCGWLLELLPQPPKAVSMAIHPICLFSLSLSLSSFPLFLLHPLLPYSLCPFSSVYLLCESSALIPYFYSGCTYARAITKGFLLVESYPSVLLPSLIAIIQRTCYL